MSQTVYPLETFFLKYVEAVIDETVIETRINIYKEKIVGKPTLIKAVATIERCIPDEETLDEVVLRFLINYAENLKRRERMGYRETSKNTLNMGAMLVNRT